MVLSGYNYDPSNPKNSYWLIRNSWSAGWGEGGAWALGGSKGQPAGRPAGATRTRSKHVSMPAPAAGYIRVAMWDDGTQGLCGMYKYSFLPNANWARVGAAAGSCRDPQARAPACGPWVRAALIGQCAPPAHDLLSLGL